MGPTSVSAVLEKLIRGLCLGDFPCGHNTWREDGPEAVLDLLKCPRSPWHREYPWSPQAASLRELAARAPEGLRADFVYACFTTLRVMGRDVSIIDEGLLRFSKLEELVLSANKIGEIPAENLPGTLKVLELRSNRLCSLDGLVGRPPPRLHYLGLASNALEDTSHFTGTHWPQLVCLDLGDCEFQDQQALLGALSTLPRLRTLVLEGNPFTLASCYPGFALDRLPKLLYLDSAWISPQERDRFGGLAQMSGLTFDWTLATVKVGKLKGILNPLKDAKDNTSSAYKYYVTYNFFSHPAAVTRISESDSQAKHSVKDTTSNNSKPQRMCENESSTPDKSDLRAHADVESVSTCSTPKVTWSEEMEFGDAQTYGICDLDGLKRFCHRGLDLSIVEEKSPVKPGSVKSKNKKRSAVQLLQDPPIRRVLGSVHVPLQSLLKRPQKVDVLCDFGLLREEPEAEAPQLENVREDGRESSRGENSSAPSKAKGHIREEDEAEESPERPAGASLSGPATLEFSVELKKWRSTAEARHHSA